MALLLLTLPSCPCSSTKTRASHSTMERDRTESVLISNDHTSSLLSRMVTVPDLVRELRKTPQQVVNDLEHLRQIRASRFLEVPTDQRFTLLYDSERCSRDARIGQGRHPQAGQAERDLAQQLRPLEHHKGTCLGLTEPKEHIY